MYIVLHHFCEFFRTPTTQPVEQNTQDANRHRVSKNKRQDSDGMSDKVKDGRRRTAKDRASESGLVL
jgi:hypothetical protein